jgi:hypothetical protein
MNTSIYYLHKGDNIPFYIGKSIKPQNRIYEHKTSKCLNVFMEIIDEVPTSEWKFWEKYYISLFKSWGFILINKNNGGGGITKQKVSSKNLISFKMKGKNNWSTGGYNKKSVLQFDLNGNLLNKYISAEEAKRKTNINNIHGCCLGKHKTVGGYIWFYEKDYNKDILKSKMYLSKTHGNLFKLKNKEHSLKIKKAVTETNKKKRKSILQYDLDGNFIKEWEYIREAAKELKLNPSGISNNIAGRIKYCGKWVWKLK